MGEPTLIIDIRVAQEPGAQSVDAPAVVHDTEPPAEFREGGSMKGDRERVRFEGTCGVTQNDVVQGARYLHEVVGVYHRGTLLEYMGYANNVETRSAADIAQ